MFRFEIWVNKNLPEDEVKKCKDLYMKKNLGILNFL